MSAPTGHLRLAKRKAGPVWLARVRAGDGRQLQRSLGPAWTTRGRAPADKLTRRDAEIELAKLIAEAGAADHRDRDHVTFATAAAAWLRARADLAASSLRDYRMTVDGVLVPALGDRELGSIGSAELNELRDRWLDQGLSPRTVEKRLTVLGSILRQAVIDGEIPINPCDAQRVRRPRVRKRFDFKTIDGDGVRRLASCAEDEQDSALFTVAGFCGLRLGELLAVEWRDVDFAGQVLHVRRAWSEVGKATKAPKSGKERSVPLSDDVIVALDLLSRRGHCTGDDDRVFVSSTGGVLDSSALRKRYGAALKRAGLPPLRLHDLRHSFCTMAIRVLPVHDVQAIAGHADIATTSRYLHSIPRPEHAAKLTAAFAGGNRASNGASNVDISGVSESV